MKVAMMGAWNTDSGASIHAELIGRAWTSMGVELKVFTFFRHSFHGTVITARPEEEEDYVNRCFTVYGAPHPEFDTRALLNSDFDVFVVEDLGMLPIPELLAIFPQIRRKAVTVNIIHDGELSDKPGFFKFAWDHNVCFDQRYHDFLKPAYPEGRLSIIPYPAFPYRPGDTVKTRAELGLPQDKKIVLLFGQAAEHAINTTLVLDRLSEKYDICVLLVTGIEGIINDYRRIIPRVGFDLRIVERSPDMDLLYKYLHASDCMIYNKHSRPTVVVASTVFQCIGAGCPIVALDSNFVDSFDREVLKYRDFYDLEDLVADVLEKGPRSLRQKEAVKEYLKDNSDRPIAGRFLDLFETLLKKA